MASLQPRRNWMAANNGAGKRSWFVFRETEFRGGPQEVYSNKHGQYRRYASYESAQRAAAKLNGAK